MTAAENDIGGPGIDCAVSCLDHGDGKNGCGTDSEVNCSGVDAHPCVVSYLKKECPSANGCGAWEGVVSGVVSNGCIVFARGFFEPLVGIRWCAGRDRGGCQSGIFVLNDGVWSCCYVGSDEFRVDDDVDSV